MVFWGCPSLRSGRSLLGSQFCSALRFFAALKKLGLALRATLQAAQPAAASPPVERKKMDQKKAIPNGIAFSC